MAASEETVPPGTLYLSAGSEISVKTLPSTRSIVICGIPINSSMCSRGPRRIHSVSLFEACRFGSPMPAGVPSWGI
jgi:hypothetical protein